MTDAVGDLLRTAAPQVLAALLKRHGGFERCEDAVQDALLEATTRWRADGVPDNPRGWLHRAATRRLIDRIRADVARKRREDEFAAEARLFGGAPVPAADDSLTLLLLCCHPAPPLRRSSRSHCGRSAG